MVRRRISPYALSTSSMLSAIPGMKKVVNGSLQPALARVVAQGSAQRRGLDPRLDLVLQGLEEDEEETEEP